MKYMYIFFNVNKDNYIIIVMFICNYGLYVEIFLNVCLDDVVVNY